MSHHEVPLPATDALGVADRPPSASRWSGGLATHLGTFTLGSIAQGAPFVLVAAALERRGVASGWIAAVAAARLAPYLLCSPVAGALAGRYEPRYVFAATGGARAAVIVALWIALQAGAPPAVLVPLLFVLIAAGTPTFPALMRALHDSAPADRLDRASALGAGLESAAFVAGPALGGLLLATEAGSMLACAVIMGIAGGIALAIPAPRGTRRPIGETQAQPIRASGRHLLRRGIRPAVVAVVGVNVLAGLDAALLVRLPAELHLGGERAFGLLTFAGGVGSLIAFLVLLSPIRRGRRPLVALAIAGAGMSVLAVASELSVAVVACCVIGASTLTAEVVVFCALSRSLPDSLVAPAVGVLDSLMVAAMISGAVVAPALTATIGLRATLAIAGIATPLLLILLVRAGDRREAAPAPAPGDRFPATTDREVEPVHWGIPQPGLADLASVLGMEASPTRDRGVQP